MSSLWGSDNKAFDEMIRLVKGYDASRLLRISRAFAHFLALSNSAEDTHRTRRLKERTHLSSPDLALSGKEDSCGGSVKRLLNQGVAPKELFNTIVNQTVEVVLTGESNAIFILSL